MSNDGIVGIDVSYAQGTIDWKKVKANGVKFVFVRVGYCYNNGVLKEDTHFKANIQGALSEGLDVGVYLFSYALTSSAAAVAANAVIEAIAPYKLTYPVVFDIEDSSAVTYSKMTRGENTAIVNSFLSVIQDKGYMGMVYASKAFLTDNLNMSSIPYEIWVAQWASKCTYAGDVGVWQYSETGKVNGINGNVDMNIAYKDYPGLINLGSQNPVNDEAKEDEPEVGYDDVEEEESDEFITYKVVKNDTLTRIARIHNIPLNLLLKSNPQIKNPDLIYVGDVINIPASKIGE